MNNLENSRQALYTARDTEDKSAIRPCLIRAARDLPKTVESLELFELGFKLLDRIENPADRRMGLLDYVKEIPSIKPFHSLYLRAMEAAIIAADALDENQRRITELMRLANELPDSPEFLPLRILAWRLVLNLPDKPRFAEPPIPRLAKELPKSSDLPFYTRYTLLGILREAPKDGPFLPVYREAMQLAVLAANSIPEPYYKRYALICISNEILKTDGLADIRKKIYEDAYKATTELTDPFARQYATLEMLQTIPKTQEYFPLLQEVLEQALGFFTIKKWMEDVEVFDVVDFILSAEDHGINESKQKRFSREKYSKLLAIELEKFGLKLNDTRFIETLKPYTHVWVQPKSLRDSIKKVVDHLQTLKSTFHGSEIERPVFVREFYPAAEGSLVHKKDISLNECISIDLGATNTVIMKKKGNAAPEFIPLAPVSRQFDSIYMVPTLLGAESNSIGAEVNEANPISNIKQMLLEGNPRGREYMERFFRHLYQHLRKATMNTGWFSILSKNPTDVLYITVPVGYQDYKGAMKEIADKVIKGTKVEFIEEPLAAAVGYQAIDSKDKVIMVVDFGGSTLNTMVLRLNIDEVHIVAKPERAQMLGGRDIDMWLAEHLAEKAGIEGEPPYSLMLAAEEIKIRLSVKTEVPFVWEGREVARITRDEFEEVLDKHEFYKAVDRTLISVLKRAEKVGLKKDRIEAILLTGGSSQIPSFKDKIGYLFPALRSKNLIYDHSPLTAVGLGAALYGTRDITDRHLGIAYALRYAPAEKDVTHSYSIVLEKGEQLPLEKTFKVKPATKLGVQTQVSLELFEVPENLLTRRWVTENGIEFLKQELKEMTGLSLSGMRAVNLPFSQPVTEEVYVTLCVSESGALKVKYGLEDRVVETGLRLQ